MFRREWLKGTAKDGAPNLDVVMPNRYRACEDAEPVIAPPDRLPADEVRRLSALAPARTVAAALVDWALIAGAVALCARFFNPVTYAVTVAFVGARQMALGVLMHEGVHFRFHRSKAWNEWLSDLLCAWPIASSTEFYRSARHIPHHRFIGLPDDPHRWQTYRDGWSFPKRASRVVGLLLKEVLFAPVSFVVVFFISLPYAKSGVALAARLGFCAGAIALCVALGAGRALVLYWLVPLVLWFPVLNAFRTMAEHTAIRGLAGDGSGAGTRTTLTGWLGKAFLFAHNINYHVEHHWYPSVPFYRLPELHAVLQARVAEGRAARYHVTRGYGRVWRELTAASPSILV